MARGKEIVIHHGQVVGPARTRGALALRIATAPARGLKKLGQMTFARGDSSMFGVTWRFFARQRFNYAAEVGDGMGSSLVMSVALWICRTFPEAPIQVLDKDGEEVENHEMVLRLRRPNPYYSGLVLWMAVLLSWVTDGNAYVRKIKNKTGTGAPVELWYIPHWMIEAKGSETEFITHYRYTVNGRYEDIPIDEMIHLRYGLDPRDPKRGLSPLATVLREVFTDDEAASFSAALLRNLGIPGLIVSPDGGAPAPSPDDVAAVKDYVDEQFGGDKRGKPMVMSGPTKVEQFGFSPEQLSLKTLRRIPEERVSAIMGIPAVVVGFGAGLDRSTYNNMGEAREQAYESNIIPTQRLMAEELWMQLLPDYEEAPEDFTVRFDVSKVRVLQEDRNKAAEREANLFKSGVKTRKAALISLGEEADDADDVYMVPINVTLMPKGESPEEELAPAPPPKLLLKGQTRAQQRLMTAFERDRAAFGAAFSEELESDFEQLGKRAADLYTEMKASTNGHGRKATDDEELTARIVTGLGLDDFADGTLKQRFEVHYQRVATQTAETINGVMDLGINLPDTAARRIIAEGGTRAGLVDLSKSTHDAIFRALAAGREAGDGPIEIARRIRSEVPAGRFVNAGPKYRAELISRTETIHAQRMSALEAYRAADSVKDVTIFDGGLEGSDEDCEARNGDVVSFDEAEQMAGDEHPNGTLAFAPNV